jgi:hypothetical protein
LDVGPEFATIRQDAQVERRIGGFYPESARQLVDNPPLICGT